MVDAAVILPERGQLLVRVVAAGVRALHPSRVFGELGTQRQSVLPMSLGLDGFRHYRSCQFLAQDGFLHEYAPRHFSLDCHCNSPGSMKLYTPSGTYTILTAACGTSLHAPLA
jgi:hypothetical protein